MLKMFALIRGMFPAVGDQAFLDDCGAGARGRHRPVGPAALLAGCDTLVRKLRSRGELGRSPTAAPRDAGEGLGDPLLVCRAVQD